MSGKPIYVTRPYMPPLEEFIPFLERIWESGMLTNDGEFHRQLERALCDYLGVAYVTLFNNGTSTLIAALRALDLRGEVIRNRGTDQRGWEVIMGGCIVPAE